MIKLNSPVLTYDEPRVGYIKLGLPEVRVVVLRERE